MTIALSTISVLDLQIGRRARLSKPLVKQIQWLLVSRALAIVKKVGQAHRVPTDVKAAFIPKSLTQLLKRPI